MALYGGAHILREARQRMPDVGIEYVPCVVTVGVLWGLGPVLVRLAERHGVTCPACRKPFSHQIELVVTSGCCGRCGAAVARPDPTPTR